MFMHRGIGFPVATARPKLEKSRIQLKWDHDLGEMEFTVPSMDTGRYWVWKQLYEKKDGWQLGTLYLSEREGKIFATATYSRPLQTAEVDLAVHCVCIYPKTETIWAILMPFGGKAIRHSAAQWS